MRAASCVASATLVALKPHNGYGLWDGSKPPTTYGKWTSEMSQATAIRTRVHTPVRRTASLANYGATGGRWLAGIVSTIAATRCAES